MNVRGIWIALVAVAVVGGTFAVSVARADEEGTSFIAVLAGANEVPARATLARGVAMFHLSEDGTTMSYMLIAANIRNVIASHIHVGAPGVNGPVVQFLFGPAPVGGGRFDGVLASGSFTSATFIGPLAGLSMDDLLDEIAAGNAYVNVHTNDGVGDVNSGPGDFPGGEIRGPIMVAD